MYVQSLKDVCISQPDACGRFEKKTKIKNSKSIWDTNAEHM